MSSLKHIAIIMDGNGRWANQRHLPRIAGHRAGVKSIKKIVPICNDLGINYLTLYAFSKENWTRPETEIKGLMALLVEFLGKEVKNIIKNDIKLKLIGDIESLPEKIQKILIKAVNESKNNNSLTLTLALNYGGRQEIMRACNNIILDYNTGKIKKNEIDNNLFQQYLYDPKLPDPDLIIRTSGEKRISNFLLWQLSYSELYATDVLWPDFDEKEFMKAINSYKKRERRFGTIK